MLEDQIQTYVEDVYYAQAEESVSDRVVYLLGAGFSAPLGLPVMSNFLMKSKDMYFSDPERFSTFKEVLEDMIDSNFDLYKKITEDSTFKELFKEFVFKRVERTVGSSR